MILVYLQKGWRNGWYFSNKSHKRNVCVTWWEATTPNPMAKKEVLVQIFESEKDSSDSVRNHQLLFNGRNHGTRNCYSQAILLRKLWCAIFVETPHCWAVHVISHLPQALRIRTFDRTFPFRSESSVQRKLNSGAVVCETYSIYKSMTLFRCELGHF